MEKTLSIYALLALFSFFFLDKPVAQAIAHYELNTLSVVSALALAFMPALHIIGSVCVALFAFAVARSYAFLCGFYAAANVVSGIFVQFAKHCVGRARPLSTLSLDPHSFIPLSGASLYHSFPSGHATVCGILAVLLTHIFPKYRVVLLIGFSMIPFVRVLQLKHFMSDVFCGLFAGMLLSLVVLKALSSVLEKKLLG